MVMDKKGPFFSQLGIALEQLNKDEAKKLWHDVIEDLGINDKLKSLHLNPETIPVGNIDLLINWLQQLSIPIILTSDIWRRVITASGGSITSYTGDEDEKGDEISDAIVDAIRIFKEENMKGSIHGRLIKATGKSIITDDYISELHERAESDLKNQLWKKDQETGKLLYRLFQDVSGFRLPPSMPSFFGDGGARTVAESATAIWLCKYCVELLKVVAEKTITKNNYKELHPSKITKDVIEILKIETRNIHKELQLKLLAQLMISLGVGLLGKETDWDCKLRELFNLQLKSSSGTGYERSVMKWAFSIELDHPNLTLEEREKSFQKLISANQSQWENWHLNDWAYLLLRLELWRPATPMAKKAMEANSWAGSIDTYGWALFFEKEYPMAEKLLQDALSTLTPGTQNWCEIKYHLLQTYFWADKLTSARIIIDELQNEALEDYWTIKATELKAIVTQKEKLPKQKDTEEYEYQIALSFAGEDRIHADQLARLLNKQGIRVFYDDFERATLWGQDLYRYLTEIYQKKAKYCVMFISNHYAKKRWTNLECRAAQARAFQENYPFIIPIKIDNTEIPGILPTVAYMSLKEDGINLIFQTLLNKLKA